MYAYKDGAINGSIDQWIDGSMMDIGKRVKEDSDFN